MHVGPGTTSDERSSSAPPSRPGPDRLVFIEGVRGVASLLVLFHHLISAESESVSAWTHTWFDPGRAGVVAFFLVSGYVIPLSLARQTSATFVRRRFYRLYPVYWMVLGAFLLAAPLVARPDEALSTPLVLIANVLMIQGLLPLATAVPTAWTLGIELVFYGQALLGRSLRLLSLPAVTGGAWLSAYAAAQTARAVLDVDVPVTLFMLLATASVGHAVHLRDATGDRTWRWLLPAALVVVPVMSVVGGDVDPAWPPLLYAVSYVGGVALFFACSAARERFTRGAMAWASTWGGAISYSLYLVHPLVYRLTVLAVPVSAVLIVAVASMASVVVALLVHLLVERPAITLGRRPPGRGGGLRRDPARHDR